MPHVFATASLARRIERAEASLVSDGAAAVTRRGAPASVFVTPIAGGVGVYAESGSPYNKVAGLGFDGVPSEADVERLEQQYAERGCAVQVELSSLGDPHVAKLFTKRGYELVNFENVLGLLLTTEAVKQMRDAAVAAITIEPVTPDQNAAWIDAVTSGFLVPDTFDGPASHEVFGREVIERIFADAAGSPAFDRYLARYEGQIAGGASLRMSEGIALMCGAATIPAYRRRGVQSALLTHRLAEAGARGGDLAAVTVQPGSKSQQNVQRFGFELLYARAILVKEP